MPKSSVDNRSSLTAGENVLRLSSTDPRVKHTLPDDGAIVQSNVLGIVKKEGDQAIAKKVADTDTQSESFK